MAKNTINVSVLADTKAFKKAMRDLGDTSGVNKLKGGVEKLGSALKNAAKLGTAAVVAIGGYATKVAADFEQSAGTIDDVFKQSAQSVHAFASQAAKDVGLSANSYNELAALIGSQLKNGGTSIDQLAGKTDNLIKLGADLSAGFGGSTVDAVSAISSALKGERDPIERYGVSLKQASIDAKAAAMGFKKVGGSLSDEAQQAATLALIMEQTTDMHGKFAREGDTLQHKIQVLRATLDNIAQRLGTALVPAISSVVGWFAEHLLPIIEKAAAALSEKLNTALNDLADTLNNDVIPALNAAKQWISENKSEILAIAAAVTGMVATWKTYQTTVAIVNGVTTAINLAKSATLAWKTTTAGMTAAQRALNLAQMENPVGLIIVGILALIAAFVILWKKSENFRQFWIGLWSKIKGVWDEYGAPIAAAVASVFSAIWNTVSAILSPILDIISGTLSAIWSVVSTILGAVFSIFATIFGAIFQVVATIFGTIFGTIADVITAIFTKISEIMTSIKETWDRVWGTIRDKVGEIWGGIKQAIEDGVRTVIEKVGGFKDDVIQKFKDAWNWLKQAGRDIIEGLWKGLKDKWEDVTGWFGKITDSISNLKGPPAKDRRLLTNNGRLIMQGFQDGLESRYGNVKDSLRRFTNTIPATIDPSTGLPAPIAFDVEGAGTNITIINNTINLHALNANAETGRMIDRALREYHEVTAR